MPAVTRFETPGALRDLPAGHAFYDTWHDTVAGLIPDVWTGVPSGEFFDPSRSNFDGLAERNLVWMGFPREHMLGALRDDRRAMFAQVETDSEAQSRDPQNEYLEWRAERTGGKIRKVVLVTETPEYWEELAQADPGRVTQLYKELVSPSATHGQIFSGPGGTYNRFNQWNVTRGIVHYIQNINTLAAAIRLARDSVSTGGTRDNFEALNTPPTSADPRVILDIGVLARKNLSITLSEPIGLYMTDWDDTGWTKPNGRPVGNYWRVRRGQPGAALRLEYEVPASEGFVVGDIRIGGRPIEFGGQLAEHVTVRAVGRAGTRRPL